MAVVYVEELFDGRDGAGDFKRQRNYTRKFEVRTNDPFDGPRNVASSILLPGLGQPYITLREGDAGALVKSVEPAQHADDPTLWIVTVKYDTQFDTKDGQAPKDRPEDPLARPPVWKFGFVKTTRPLVKDINGNPILNTAGCYFDPPAEEEVAYLTISITQNKAFWWADQARALMKSVNKKAWYTLPPRTVRFMGQEAESKYENNLQFWSVTTNLEVHEETWDLVLLNAGFAELRFNPATGKNELFEIRDGTGRGHPQPYLLSKEGFKLPATGNPYWLTFKIYNEIDYNGIIP